MVEGKDKGGSGSGTPTAQRSEGFHEWLIEAVLPVLESPIMQQRSHLLQFRPYQVVPVPDYPIAAFLS